MQPKPPIIHTPSPFFRIFNKLSDQPTTSDKAIFQRNNEAFILITLLIFGYHFRVMPSDNKTAKPEPGTLMIRVTKRLRQGKIFDYLQLSFLDYEQNMTQTNAPAQQFYEKLALFSQAHEQNYAEQIQALLKSASLSQNSTKYTFLSPLSRLKCREYLNNYDETTGNTILHSAIQQEFHPAARYLLDFLPMKTIHHTNYKGDNILHTLAASAPLKGKSHNRIKEIKALLVALLLKGLLSDFLWQFNKAGLMPIHIAVVNAALTQDTHILTALLAYDHAKHWPLESTYSMLKTPEQKDNQTALQLAIKLHMTHGFGLPAIQALLDSPASEELAPPLTTTISTSLIQASQKEDERLNIRAKAALTILQQVRLPEEHKTFHDKSIKTVKTKKGVPQTPKGKTAGLPQVSQQRLAQIIQQVPLLDLEQTYSIRWLYGCLGKREKYPDQQAEIINAIARFDAMGKSVQYTILSGICEKKFTSLSLRHCPILLEKPLSGFFNSNFWTLLFEENKTLKKLTLENCHGISTKHIQQLTQWCPTLQSLTLISQPIDALEQHSNWFSDASAIRFPSLQHLEVKSCKQITTITIEAQNLKTLSLLDCQKLRKVTLGKTPALTQFKSRNSSNLQIFQKSSPKEEKSKHPLSILFGILAKHPQYKINFEKPNTNGYPFPHQATQIGNSAILRWMIDADAPINLLSNETRGNPNRETVLHVAVRAKQLKTLEYLLSLPQIEKNKRNQAGQTALHLAVLLADFDAVKLLCASGLNLFLRDCKGRRPIDCVQVNKTGEKGEHYAAIFNYLSLKMHDKIPHASKLEEKQPRAQQPPDLQYKLNSDTEQLLHHLTQQNYPQALKEAMRLASRPSPRQSLRQQTIPFHGKPIPDKKRLHHFTKGWGYHFKEDTSDHHTLITTLSQLLSIKPEVLYQQAVSFFLQHQEDYQSHLNNGGNSTSRLNGSLHQYILKVSRGKTHIDHLLMDAITRLKKINLVIFHSNHRANIYRTRTHGATTYYLGHVIDENDYYRLSPMQFQDHKRNHPSENDSLRKQYLLTRFREKLPYGWTLNVNINERALSPKNKPTETTPYDITYQILEHEGSCLLDAVAINANIKKQELLNEITTYLKKNWPIFLDFAPLATEARVNEYIIDINRISGFHLQIIPPLAPLEEVKPVKDTFFCRRNDKLEQLEIAFNIDDKTIIRDTIPEDTLDESIPKPFNLTHLKTIFPAILKILSEKYSELKASNHEPKPHITMEVIVRALQRPIIVVGPGGLIKNSNFICQFANHGRPILVYSNCKEGKQHYDAVNPRHGWEQYAYDLFTESLTSSQSPLRVSPHVTPTPSRRESRRSSLNTRSRRALSEGNAPKPRFSASFTSRLSQYSSDQSPAQSPPSSPLESSKPLVIGGGAPAPLPTAMSSDALDLSKIPKPKLAPT